MVARPFLLVNFSFNGIWHKHIAMDCSSTPWIPRTVERHVAAPELELQTSAAAAAVQRPAQQIPMAKLELELEQARAKIREMQSEVNHQLHPRKIVAVG